MDLSNPNLSEDFGPLQKLPVVRLPKVCFFFLMDNYYLLFRKEGNLENQANTRMLTEF